MRRDLLQDIHLAIWRSLATFDGRCALRTWVYRVAHNTAISHVSRAIRLRFGAHLTLDELDALPLTSAEPLDVRVDQQRARERVSALIRQLGPFDRQVMVLYLEGLEAAEIAEIVGLSPGAVATKPIVSSACWLGAFTEVPLVTDEVDVERLRGAWQAEVAATRGFDRGLRARARRWGTSSSGPPGSRGSSPEASPRVSG